MSPRPAVLMSFSLSAADPHIVEVVLACSVRLGRVGGGRDGIPQPLPPTTATGSATPSQSRLAPAGGTISDPNPFPPSATFHPHLFPHLGPVIGRPDSFGNSPAPGRRPVRGSHREAECVK